MVPATPSEPEPEWEPELAPEPGSEPEPPEPDTPPGTGGGLTEPKRPRGSGPYQVSVYVADPARLFVGGEVGNRRTARRIGVYMESVRRYRSEGFWGL